MEVVAEVAAEVLVVRLDQGVGNLVHRCLVRGSCCGTI